MYRTYHSLKAVCNSFSRVRSYVSSGNCYQSIFDLTHPPNPRIVCERRTDHNTGVYFIKRVDKGQIATVKDLKS